MSDHEQLEEWAGAYVLGALDRDDRSMFERHLSACDICRTNVAEFAPIPALLSKADPLEPVPVPASVLDTVGARIASERSAIVASRSRWRVAAVAAVVGLLFVLSQGWNGPTPEVTEVALEPSWGVSGEVTLAARGWGTEVEFVLADLPPDVTCIGWVVGSDGEWQQVAWWGPTASHRASVTGASSVQLQEVAEVVVTTTDRDEIVTRAAIAEGGSR